MVGTLADSVGRLLEGADGTKPPKQMRHRKPKKLEEKCQTGADFALIFLDEGKR